MHKSSSRASSRSAPLPPSACARHRRPRPRPRSTPPISSPPAPPMRTSPTSRASRTARSRRRPIANASPASSSRTSSSQADVDMLTKMHKDEISDDDAENYPTLEDLMNANEGYEDALPDEPRASRRRGQRRRGGAGERTTWSRRTTKLRRRMTAPRRNRRPLARSRAAPVDGRPCERCAAPARRRGSPQHFHDSPHQRPVSR